MRLFPLLPQGRRLPFARSAGAIQAIFQVAEPTVKAAGLWAQGFPGTCKTLAELSRATHAWAPASCAAEQRWYLRAVPLVVRAARSCCLVLFADDDRGRSFRGNGVERGIPQIVKDLTQEPLKQCGAALIRILAHAKNTSQAFFEVRCAKKYPRRRRGLMFVRWEWSWRGFKLLCELVDVRG